MTSEEESVAYFYLLGSALAAWSRIEARLFNVMAMCINSDSHAQLGMGFVQIQGFRNKLLFADGALSRFLHGTEAKVEWTDLCADLNKASWKRNDLAHYQTGLFASAAEGRRWALCPWQMKKDRDRNKPPEGSYCMVDLDIVTNLFYALEARLSNFHARACGNREPYPKSVEQPLSPRTTEQIRRRIHEALGHPHQSAAERKRAEDEKNAAASLLVELPMKAALNATLEDAKLNAHATVTDPDPQKG